MCRDVAVHADVYRRWPRRAVERDAREGDGREHGRVGRSREKRRDQRRRAAESATHRDEREARQRLDEGLRRTIHRIKGIGRRVRPHRGRGPRQSDRDRQELARRRRRGAPGRGALSATEQITGEAVAAVFREEAGRLTAALIRSLGDFDVAEESVQDALVAALEHWPREGLPANAGAWLMTTARRKGIDRLPRETRYREKVARRERPRPRDRGGVAHLAARAPDAR